MFSDIDGFPIWLQTLMPDPAPEGGVDYLVFPQADTPGGLTATPISSGSTVGQPAIAQTHALTATALVSGSTVGQPTAAQVNILTATGLASAPTTGRPTIGQTHALTPVALRCGTSTGTPTAGIVTITYDLSATALASGSTTGRPDIGQAYGLTATPIKAVPVLDRPELYMGIGLTATPLVSGSLVGIPALRIVSPTRFITLTLDATLAAPIQAGASTTATRSLRCGYSVNIDGDQPVRVTGAIPGSTKITEVLQ